MRQQGPVTTDSMLQPSAAPLRKTPVTRQVSIRMSLADIPQLLTRHVGFVEGNHG
jgi:hypothetical protein